MVKHLWKKIYIFCRDSYDYVKQNEESIAMINYKNLKMGNVICLVMLALYFICARTFFPQFDTDAFYVTAILILSVVELILLTDVVTKLSAKWINRICAMFEMLFLLFILYISVIPLDLEMPGLYYAPVVITFAVVFIFPFTETVFLAVVEAVIYVVLSGLLKSQFIFLSNMFASVATIAVVCVCAFVLSKLRIKDNNSKNQLEELCAVDKLTGLNNKATCELLCKSYLLENPIGNCALMMVDFDNFKGVNDSFGHKQGDEVLKEFGKILRKASRETDVAGRVGGDEFIILFKGCSDHNWIRERALQIIRCTHEIMQDVLSYEFTCSIGIAVQDGEEYTYEKLLSKADVALYEAKKNGRNRMHFYEDPVQKKKEVSTGEKPVLLVVDDMEVSRAVLRSCLGSRFDIVEAENGEEAIRYMEDLHDRLSLVLLDIEMPIMNGYEVIHYMKKSEKLSDLPVIVITVNEKSEYQILELGVADVVTKPFDPLVVRERVNRAIQNRNKIDK